MTHAPDPQLFERPINVLVFGCGGNGSAIAGEHVLGLNWHGLQVRIEQLKSGVEVDILIGCVDTRRSGRAINRWALGSRVLYWLDLGNNPSSGQNVLSHPKNSANRNKKDRLLTVSELYPEIVSSKRKEDDQPS